MKSAKSIVLVFLLITSFSCLSICVLAQNKQTKQADIFEHIDKLNGNDMIERLAAQRNAFNKTHLKNNLPKAEYIINRNNLTLISFNGLDYYVKNNRVIGIQGLNLSDKVLNQITDKLVLLDSIQFNQSERSNIEYVSPNADFQKIRNIDRQFMLTLKMLSSTVRDIAALAKNENPSLTVETNVAKMRLPNVDKAAEKSSTQSLVSLAK
ncbi:hypothetical protein [Pedobacter sp. SG918]|uniref:hypothetical protein n=1 Tax=Pedobacter sp. SG918 TaxID=2587136 RepID=UPI00146DB595|nr:hypothetical protein [Pedobacter sp. SG918]NMN36209.1 hypothetical protein [Pedobacter sp. SG918]